MKQTIQISLVFTAFFLAAFTTSVSAQTRPAPPDLKATMVTLTANWQDAYNREDVNALSTMYADKVVAVAPDGTSATITREEIKVDLTNDFVEHNERMEITLGSVVQRPDGNVRITGTFTSMEVDPATGAITRESGIFDHVLAKVAGVWKLSQIEVTPNN